MKCSDFQKGEEDRFCEGKPNSNPKREFFIESITGLSCEHLTEVVPPLMLQGLTNN